MGEREYRDSANFTAEQHEAVAKLKADERKPNLYDLASIYRECGEIIAEYGGDIDHPYVQEALATLTKAEGSIDRKIDVIRELIRDFKDDARSRRQEAELRISRAQSLEATAKRLEQWAIAGIERAGLKRAGSIVPMSVCNNGGALGVEWKFLSFPIPEEYRIEKVVYEIDREKVLDAYARGEKLPPGLMVKERGKHLRAVGLSRKATKGGDDVEAE